MRTRLLAMMVGVGMLGVVDPVLSQNIELVEFKCVEFSEELVCGHLRQKR